jgi:hypothetical protein
VVPFKILHDRRIQVQFEVVTIQKLILEDIMMKVLISTWLLLPLCFGFNNKTKRIAGGQDVGWDRYPYFALLEIKWREQTTDPIRTNWCGSVVIATSSLLVRPFSLLNGQRYIMTHFLLQDCSPLPTKAEY